jgi:alkanesulfonate monooxygenase SsuD/methylene tetrahydromethanopterin reductase-like flavin-dependent oxidoreductase (luciferase family)
VALTDERAREEFWTSYQPMRDRIGAERGWQPIGRAQFEREIERGSLHVGSPETVARRVVETVTALGACRFDMKYSAGALPHDKLLNSIELYGTKVIPLVREMAASANSV